MSNGETIFGAWRHVFKLDPDKAISDAALERVCCSGTDAIIVGGSSGITFDNTVELLSRIRRFELPCALEVTTEEAAVPGFDLYFVPMVLNTSDAGWITGRQAAAVQQFGTFIPWDSTAAEGYIILNGEATAAKLTGANASLDTAEVAALARVADRLMRLPIIYLEYSGKFGDMSLVRRVRSLLTQGRLFYGGGIASAEQAAVAAAAAHTIIVGNVVYEDLDAAIATVDAAKSAEDI